MSEPNAYYHWQDLRLFEWLKHKHDQLRFGGGSHAMLKSVAEVWFSSVMKTFEQQGRPEKWQAWSDAYAEYRKEHKPGKILQYDTTLLHSIATSIGKMAVYIGTNLVYAARMQFGWPRGSADETPARPYIQPPIDDDWKEIEEIVLQWAFGEAV